MPVDYDLPAEGMIYQRDQYAKGGVGRRYWDYRDARILRHLPRCGLILDAGCGEGITLERLVRERGERRLLGVDRSEENRQICVRHGLPVIGGSVFELGIRSNSVDACLFLEVIEHLDHPEAALREFARVLKVGGLLLVLFPNDLVFALARLATGKWREALYDPGHVKQWTPREMRRALAAAGFTVVAEESLPFRFWPISLHHLVVAKRRAD
ncbi:MAG: class I SAM-dependent methyltransferase [Nitrospirota bacterium]